MLFRNGTHMLDAIMWFAGGRPQWVVAELEDGYEEYGEYRGDGGHDPATEPSANALIRFDNGVRGVYQGDKQAQRRTEFIVSGTEGRILIAGGKRLPRPRRATPTGRARRSGSSRGSKPGFASWSASSTARGSSPAPAATAWRSSR